MESFNTQLKELIDSIKEKSFKEGVDSGYEAGYLDGKADGIVETQEKITKDGCVWFKNTCKTENSPADERKTDQGMFIPESPNEAVTGDLHKRIEKIEKDLDRALTILSGSITSLQGNLCKLEKEVYDK